MSGDQCPGTRSPGLYALARDPDKVDTLKAVMGSEFCWQCVPDCPPRLPLYLLQDGDCRALAITVSCGQAIAGDGAFSLAMITDYRDSLASYGAAFYRNRLLLRRSSPWGLRHRLARVAEFLPLHGGRPG